MLSSRVSVVVLAEPSGIEPNESKRVNVSVSSSEGQEGVKKEVRAAVLAPMPRSTDEWPVSV